MKFFILGLLTASVFTFVSCRSQQPPQPQAESNEVTQTELQKNSGQVQTENINKAAFEKAVGLTSGWPESSTKAARELIVKYGDPTDRTSDTLIWKNAAPFKRIVVHKEVYSSRFPLLHQNAVEHVVNYKAPSDKVDDVWQFNESIVLDRNRGEMSAKGENEAMNILALNLASEVMEGTRTPASARIKFGQDTLARLDGRLTSYSQSLRFGNQMNTSDQGKTITQNIRWVEDRKSGEPQAQQAPKDQKVKKE